MKRYHVLTRTPKFLSPRRCVFFDTETKYHRRGDFIEHEFWFGYLIYNDGDRRVERLLQAREDFWDFLDREFEYSKEEIYCVAHNAFFDFMIVGGFQYALARGWHLARPPVTDKGIFIAKFERGKEVLYFLNLGNWFKSSLRELGKTFGLEKLEMPTRETDFRRWIEYCKRDVEIVERVFYEFLSFIHENELGGLSYTIAAQAFNSFRYRFMPVDIFVHAHPGAMELERDAYHGGRTEAFHVGTIEGEIYELDVHSMYPSVMLSEVFPVKLIRFIERGSDVDYYKYRERGKLIIADVVVEVDKPLVPLKNGIFGQRVTSQNGARLLAPVGRFRTVLTSVEIDFLLKHGGKIVEWGRMAIYDCAKIFENYVQYFYTLKEEAGRKKDKARYLLYKLFLNSLYGKFGQRGARWRKVGECEDTSRVMFETMYDSTGKRRSMRAYAGVVEITDDPTDSFDSFTAIACFVTAYAWVKLTEYIICAGWENVYYCDTDSIFCNREGYERLVRAGAVSDELGKLGLEIIAERVVIHGLKDYQLSVKNSVYTKLKGVSKDAILVLTKDSTFVATGKDVDMFLARCEERGIHVEKVNGAFVIKKGVLALTSNDLGIVSTRDLIHDLDVEIEEYDDTAYAQIQWLSFAGHVRYKQMGKYLNRIIVKKLQRKYEKGVVREDGRVEPVRYYLDQSIDALDLKLKLMVLAHRKYYELKSELDRTKRKYPSWYYEVLKRFGRVQRDTLMKYAYELAEKEL